MKTKEEITAIVAGKLYKAEYNALVYSDLASYVGGLSQKGKNKLMLGILEGRDADVGQFLREGMVSIAESNALTKATSMMIDDALTLTELQQIF